MVHLMAKPHIRVVAGQIEQGGRYLIAQRRPSSSLPLLWEFPGGRVEDGESDAEALVRELREAMAMEVEVGQPAISVTHEYPKYVVDLVVLRCKMLTPESELKRLGVHAFRFVHPDELDAYDFPGADQDTIDRLLRL